MAIATVDDIADRVGRPLVGPEVAQAEAYIADAEARVKAFIPDAESRASLDPVFEANFRSVVCAAAIRAGNFAQDVTAPVPTDGSIQYSPTTAPGYVAIRKSEWRQLGVRKGMFYVRGF